MKGKKYGGYSLLFSATPGVHTAVSAAAAAVGLLLGFIHQLVRAERGRRNKWKENKEIIHGQENSASY